MINTDNIKVLGFKKDICASTGELAPVSLLIQFPEQDSVNAKQTNEGGWRDSDLRKRLHPGGDLFESLPKDLKKIIVPTVHYTGRKGSECIKTEDYLYLLSVAEVAGKEFDSDYNLYEESRLCKQYDFFKNPNNRIIYNAKGEPVWWWLRSTTDSKETFLAMHGDALVRENFANSSGTIVCGFAIR